jgi:hypothetical protein
MTNNLLGNDLANFEWELCSEEKASKQTVKKHELKQSQDLALLKIHEIHAIDRQTMVSSTTSYNKEDRLHPRGRTQACGYPFLHLHAKYPIPTICPKKRLLAISTCAINPSTPPILSHPKV